MNFRKGRVLELTIRLTPATASVLQSLARQRGISVEGLLEELVRTEAALSANTSLNGLEKANAFLAWADSFPDTPLLSDEAIGREVLNPDRL